MRRVYGTRQVLVTGDGKLVAPEEVDRAAAAARPGSPRPPAPDPTGLPWVRGSQPTRCASCQQPAKVTLEGNRKRLECPRCGWVATANQRQRLWEIEEARKPDASM